MSVEILTLDNLSHFKTKQDEYNDSKFATKASVPTKFSQLENDSEYQTKTQLDAAINQAVASVMTYKGTKATVGELPSDDNKIGDVWHITADNAEYAWDGTKWEVLGSTMNVSIAWNDIAGKPSEFPPATHTHDDATTDSSGFMSAADKTKLDGIAEGATKYIHPDVKQLTAGLYKFATNAQGHVTEGTVVTKDDIVALGIPAQDTTYSVATSENDGLMASTDKVKLDGLDNMTPVDNSDIDSLFS